jgi:hypothetical protein
MPLASLAQLDFSSGMWRSVARHLIPADGAYDLKNVLLTEEGSPYRRGGAGLVSTAPFGASGLTLVWDGFLVPGQRTLTANSSDFGTLDAAEAPVNLGGSGVGGPARCSELGGIVFVDGGAMWAGSRLTAGYSTGTVSVTNGSAVVEGSGTDWDPSVDAGMLFKRGSERSYVVKSRDSDTQITLSEPYEGVTGSGIAYSLSPIATAAAPYKSSAIYAVAGDRLWALADRKAEFSEPGKPHSFLTDDNHEFPEGSQLLGGAGLGDRLLAFSTNGVWQVSGLAYDLTDAFGNVQHRVERVYPDLILASREGITGWSGRLVVPCTDHIYLLDGVSAPEALTRSISELYRDYIERGFKVGGCATFQSHLFAPILSGSNTVEDLLVCRLDRAQQSPVGTVFPWTRLDGWGGDMSCFTVRSGGAAAARDPQLLAASTRTESRVANCTPFFGPDLDNKNDPDNSTPELDIVSRDVATGNGRNENTVRRIRVRYELKDAASDDPTLTAYWSDGEVDLTGIFLWGQNWGSDWAEPDEGEWKTLEGSAPEDEGREPFVWHVNKRVRYIRFRFRSSSPTTKLVLRTLEMFVRPTGKD